jgi:Tol biopolymer transport system component
MRRAAAAVLVWGLGVAQFGVAGRASVRFPGGCTPFTLGDQGYQTSWLPDGRQVAYVSMTREQRALRSVDTATRRTTLLFDVRRAAAVLCEGLWNLRSINVDNGEHVDLTPAAPPGAYVRYPDWSPVGNLVLFERAEMRGNIWTLNLQ